MMAINDQRYDSLFRMYAAHAPNALHVRPVADETWKPFEGSRDQLSRLAKGETSPAGPLKFSRFSGDVPMDLITTTSVRMLLASNRVFDCFRRNNFSGWSTYPVTIAGKEDMEVPDYQGLAVRGRCGAIDPSLSIRTLRPGSIFKDAKDDVMMGVFFDLNTWDGSHIFTPNGGYFVVMEEVKTAMEDIGATNMKFTRLSELENSAATMAMRRAAGSDQ